MIRQVRHVGKIPEEHFPLSGKDSGGAKSLLITANRFGHTIGKDCQRKAKNYKNGGDIYDFAQRTLNV